MIDDAEVVYIAPDRIDMRGAQNTAGLRIQDFADVMKATPGLISQNIQTEYNRPEGMKPKVVGTLEEDERERDYGEQRGASVFCKFKQRNGDLTILVNKAGLVVSGTGNEINYGQGTSTDGVNTLFDRERVFEMPLMRNADMFPNALRRSGSCSGQRYSRIISQMRHFQDNGLFRKMESYSQRLLHGYSIKGEIDLQVVIKIQKGVFSVYDMNLSTAEIEFREAMDLAERAENRQLLTAQCFLYLAHVSMYKKDYEEAMVYLERARSFLVFYVSGEDSSLLLYLRGCILMRKAGELIELSESLGSLESFESEAIACFEEEMGHAMMEKDDAAVAKKLEFATLKKVSVLLRTYSASMYDLDVSRENINKAKSLIDDFELRYWEGASTAAKLHFAVHRADYFCRMGQPKRALSIVETEGQLLAKSIGHSPLIQMVESRIEVFEKFVAHLTVSETKCFDEVSDEIIEELLNLDN